MLNPDHKIALQKTPSLYLYYTVIISMLIAITSPIWLLLDPNLNIALIFVISIIPCLLIGAFFLIILLRSEYFVNTTVNHQFPENLDSSNTVHDAFILIHSVGSSGDTCGLDNLISTFKAKKYPFKIYHCYTPDDFKAVLANEKAKYVWIFGHGWRGGIAFKWRPYLRDRLHLKWKKETVFQYSDLIENGQTAYPSKDFIAQLHCNNPSKKDLSNVPLPEILMEEGVTPEMYHVSDKFYTPCSVWFTTRKLAKTVKRTPINVSGGGEK